MNVTFIGAGNVAWHLAQALEDAGHMVQHVYSRRIQTARDLAGKLYKAEPTQSLDLTASKATVFFVALPDQAVETVSAQLQLPEHAILIHTSGTLPLDVLSKHALRGVFYPLQTFSKQKKVNISEVPLCIEATDDATAEILVGVAQSISNTVYLINSHERKVLHIAAVFACNFTNHLLAIAHQLTMQEGLEFHLLSPLIKETIQKALVSENPAAVQTGPAIRHDTSTIDAHLEYLSAYPAAQQIYQSVTQSIIEKAGHRSSKS